MSNRRRSLASRDDGWHVADLLDEAQWLGLTKQETPEGGTSEASTDRTTLLEVPGGCSPECA